MAKIDKHGKSSPKHPNRAAGKNKNEKRDDKQVEKKASGKKPEMQHVTGTWRHDFAKADKNQDGKLAKSEMKLAKQDPKAFDANGNGQVTKQEFHAGHRKANSFAGLDQDRDGALNSDEMAKLKRFTKESYDGDGDGNVTEQEFVASRRIERVAIREAVQDAKFDALDGKQKKALKHYDTDADGKISREEFGAGRDTDWQASRDAKIAANFKKAGGKDGVLKTDAAADYKDYDKDADGSITSDEFTAGQLADRHTFWKGNLTQGGVDKMVARRLDLDALGKGINRVDGKGQRPDKPGPKDPTDPTGAKTEVVVSSFNILGSSHTAPGGKHPEMASGPERMKGALALLKEHQVDVVGMQEMQRDQLATFKKLAGDKYGIYPGQKLGRRGIANSIAWDKSKWDLVKPGHVNIPYFNGNKRPMPVVLLRNKQTGEEAYFANFHNPADTRDHHHQERFRDEATRLQVALANKLRKTGKPVFITGDMNEHEEYNRHMTKGSPGMHASSAKNGKLPKRTGIDWIFGSPDVKFSRHIRDQGAKVQRTTDHPMIVTHAKF